MTDKIGVRQAFSGDFTELIQGLSNDILKIEAIDPESLNIPARKAAYHSVNNENMTGEENANVGKSTHPNHRRKKVYEGMEKMSSYDLLHSKMTEKYSKEVADEALLEVIAGTGLINDSENIDLPYCVAFSSSFLMREDERGGRPWSDVPNIAPTTFRSYISVVAESMFDACSEFMGATVVFDINIGGAFYSRQEREAMKLAHRGMSFDMAANALASNLVTSRRGFDEAVEKIKENSTTVEEACDYVYNHKLTNSLQHWVHLAGNKFRNGYQSLFTNLNLFSPRILKDNFEYYRYPSGENIDGYIDEIIILQKIFADFFSQGIKGHNGLTKIVAMPVVTLMKPKDDVGAEELQEADDEFVDYILGKFATYNNINVYRGLKLAMCCRITVDKPKVAVAVNSLGVTTEHDGNNAVGSLRVVTTSLPAIALDMYKDVSSVQAIPLQSRKDAYLYNLTTKLDISVRILEAQREIIMERDSQNFYKLSEAGWVDFTKLASTLGGLGLYEAVKLVFDAEWGTEYTDEELAFANDIVALFNDICINKTEELGFPINMELCIPGESAAFRFAERERILFGEDAVNYPELSNQFTPLTLNFDIAQRLKWEEVLSEITPPSGICHINIDAPLTPEQNIKLHRQLWKMYPNIEHYAFNSTIYTCVNHHNYPDHEEGQCKLCGGDIINAVSRSIGYFKSTIFDFGKNRKDEHSRRTWHKTETIEKM